MTAGNRSIVGALSGATASSLAVLAAADHNSFSLEDVGGLAFVFCVAPLVGAVAGVVLGLAFRRMHPVAAVTTVAVLVFAAGWLGYDRAITRRLVPGYFRVPGGFQTQAHSVAELETLVFSPNPEVRELALVDIAGRGPAGNDALYRIVDRVRLAAGRAYVNDYLTLRATELLSKAHDQRAIPILLEMENRSTYSNTARALLREHFPDANR